MFTKRERTCLHDTITCFERASLELFDLMEEVDEEIQELTRELRKTA